VFDDARRVLHLDDAALLALRGEAFGLVGALGTAVT
jgi:hypothetical protein